MTDRNAAAEAAKGARRDTTVLRLVVAADLGEARGYGQQQITIWVERGVERPALAAAMVRLGDEGETWDALGWSPDGPRELAVCTSHDKAVARAVQHAREVANGTERERSDQRQRDREIEQALWKGLEDQSAPGVAGGA